MQPAVFDPPDFPDYALLDSGEAEKLERFGPWVLRRPDPQALWPRRLEPGSWQRADLSFVRESDRGGRWERGARMQGQPAEPSWPIEFERARLLVRPTPFKHVGVFPEQAANWRLLRELRPAFGERTPRLLNLFGYTGAASVVAALAGYETTHVDAARPMLAQVRENQAASGLPEDAIRVLLDDALAFARREVRRGARYEVVLLDPPHSGRGPKGEKWQFETGIAPLLESVASLVTERALVVLSTYAIGFSPLSLRNLLFALEGGECDVRELVLREGEPVPTGRLLPAGFCARWSRGLELPS